MFFFFFFCLYLRVVVANQRCEIINAVAARLAKKLGDDDDIVLSEGGEIANQLVRGARNE
jgi:hypothetical protein